MTKTTTKPYKAWVQLQRHYASMGKAVFGFIYGFIALFGIASGDWKTTLALGLAFYLVCYLAGRWYCLHGWFEAEIEVNNKFNPFVKEMRESISGAEVSKFKQ